jgi:nitrite reductase/ring-hydroxylating ferredoxin subunit
MAEFVKVAKTNQIKLNESISVKANGNFIAIGNNKGKFFAVSDICPHAGAPLGGGWVEEDCIVCPHHYWKFNLETGDCPHIPGEKVITYELKVEGDEIFVKIP